MRPWGVFPNLNKKSEENAKGASEKYYFKKTQNTKRKYLPVSPKFGIKIEESSLAVDRTGSHLLGIFWKHAGKVRESNFSSAGPCGHIP